MSLYLSGPEGRSTTGPFDGYPRSFFEDQATVSVEGQRCFSAHEAANRFSRQIGTPAMTQTGITVPPNERLDVGSSAEQRRVDVQFAGQLGNPGSNKCHRRPLIWPRFAFGRTTSSRWWELGTLSDEAEEEFAGLTSCQSIIDATDALELVGRARATLCDSDECQI